MKRTDSLHAITDINLKYIMVSDRSQTQKITYSMIEFIQHSGKGNFFPILIEK